MRRTRVKLSPGQLDLFMQRDFDSRTVLLGTYDFVTCKRADGSIYGNGGTQCKKGAETTKEDVKKEISKRNKKVSEDLEKTLNGGVAQDSAVSSAVSKSSIEAAQKDIKIRTAELREKMANGEDLSSEIQNYVENKRFIGNTQTAPVIVLGIEDGTPSGVRKGKEFDEFFAEKMAVNEYKLKNPDKSEAADLVEKPIDFNKTQMQQLSTIRGEAFSPQEMLMPGGRVAQVELRSLPSSTENDWGLNGPKYAENSGVTTRKEYMKTYEEPMAKSASKLITGAVDKNPNLHSVVLAARGKGTDMIVDDLASRPGAKVREFEYDVNNRKVKGRIIDPKGDGKTMVYDYGTSLSAYDSKARWFSSGTRFAQEEARLRAGETTKYTKPDSIRKKEAKVAREAKKAANERATTERRTAREARRTGQSTSTRRTTRAVSANKSSQSKSNANNVTKPSKTQLELYLKDRQQALRKAKQNKNSAEIKQLESTIKRVEGQLK